MHYFLVWRKNTWLILLFILMRLSKFCISSIKERKNLSCFSCMVLIQTVINLQNQRSSRFYFLYLSIPRPCIFHMVGKRLSWCVTTLTLFLGDRKCQGRLEHFTSYFDRMSCFKVRYGASTHSVCKWHKLWSSCWGNELYYVLFPHAQIKLVFLGMVFHESGWTSELPSTLVS